MTAHRQIRPSMITCGTCGGTASDPAADKHAAHKPGCDAPAGYTAAMAAARDVGAQATYEMAILAAARGTRAVAEAAYARGGLPVDALQQRYEDLQARTLAAAREAA